MGGTEGMVVRAAVHAARTTLSGSREKGTFVSVGANWYTISSTPCKHRGSTLPAVTTLV